MMHLFNPDPIEEPLNWTAYLIHDMSDAYYGDWGDQRTLTTGTYGPEQYFYPSITMSAEEESDVMWYAGFTGDEYTYQEDSTLYVPGDIDLYMAKSIDNGVTWTELENTTNTSGTLDNKALEVGIHLASAGTDDQVGVFFQMPEFTVETYPPAAGFEDYMNRVYVSTVNSGIWKNTPTWSSVPALARCMPTSSALLSSVPDVFVVFSSSVQVTPLSIDFAM
jgi:hypothetical protein